MGCGTGIFTLDILSFGPRVIGLDISRPMIKGAYRKLKKYPFKGIVGDMMCLPFADNSFDKVVSVTAIEFVQDAQRAVYELFRVTKRSGRVVVTTLNSLSPWAARRIEKAGKGPSIFEKTIFRSPDDIRSLSSVNGRIQTAVHFQKDDAPGEAHKIEREGRRRGLMTGAFLAAEWVKP